MHTNSTSQQPKADTPLTASEKLIWTGQRLEPDAPLYNMALALDVAGTVDATALQEALTRIVRRADSLRTVIRGRSGAPTRMVLDQLEIELGVVEIPENRRSAEEVTGLLEERTRRIFELDTAMTDVALFRLGPDRSILYVNQHHLITDASSTGVLYRRLATEYAMALEGSPPSAEALPQYGDYVQRLSKLQASPEFDRARRYWKDTRPPRDSDIRFYGAPSIGSGRSQRVRRSLGPDRTAALEELIGRPGFRALTPEHSRFLVFATVLGAWHSRVSDESRIAIGTPSHNRTTADDRETLGLFIELYPLRLEFEEDETFASLARKVGAGTLEMMRHVVPGASASPNTRDFRVVLNYITARIGDFAGSPAHADWVHSGFGDREHALRLQVHDFDDSGVPTLDFDLDTSIFGKVERMWAVEHFFALFDRLVTDPETPISAVPLVSFSDEAGFAPRGESVPAGPDVVTRFLQQVTKHPDDEAVVEGDQTFSYRDLATRVHAVASSLREKGAGDGDVVGICLPRGVDHIAAMLGTLMAGAAYLPLDPAHPDDRLSYQIEDSQVQTVLTRAEDAERVEAWGVAPLVPDMRSSSVESLDSGFAWSGAPAHALAYVLYTSGSTGRPKGVENTHGALTDYVAWASRTYDGGERLRWGWFTSSAYDLTVTSIFTPLVSGGSVFCYIDPQEAAGLLVRDVVTDNRVDIIKLTPSHLELLRDLNLAGSRIRRVVLGGEDLKAASALRAHQAFGGRTEIFNEYGPTEATVGCMLHRFDPERDIATSVPIGVPADNARIHVVGPGGGPTVRGESGEICVAGPRVARGYRGKPELTAQTFVEDPLVHAGVMYRTGDQGRWNADGLLEFLGRRDDQVKVGGLRLELGEVEAALALHPAIRETAALLVHSGRSSGHVRCQVCGLEANHPESQIDESGLCSLCARFELEKDHIAGYFGTLEDLEELLRDARKRSEGPHDCVMLYSGGKDSTYALCQIVELGARPLVFLLDNGFISDHAKENVRRVTDLLGLELVVGSTPIMPEIFAESLSRFSNVCQGCFKTVYTLALNLAIERGIGAIVTGLSRGQIFETRLADLYRHKVYDPDVVDRTILEARKTYHRMDDSVSGLFDVDGRSVDEVLDTVRFIDFYRYTAVELDEMLRYVDERTPWIRPPDTGRSTNCLINEAGIFVHLEERGFHNYALPYSWDVRLGHKERNAAVAELDDELNPAAIRRMLAEVGYRERPARPSEARLIAYYTGDEVSTNELRRAVATRLPEAAIPASFIRLDAMPLTDHGKIDRKALPVPGKDRPALAAPFVEPTTPTERVLATIWGDVLGLARVGVHDDFFELGGESLRCVQIASAARDAGLEFSPRELFAARTVARLSEVVRAVAPGDEPVPAEVGPDELDSLTQEFGQ